MKRYELRLRIIDYPEDVDIQYKFTNKSKCYSFISELGKKRDDILNYLVYDNKTNSVICQHIISVKYNNIKKVKERKFKLKSLNNIDYE